VASPARPAHPPRRRTLLPGLTGEFDRLVDTSAQLSGLGHLETIAREQVAAAAQGVQPKITVAIPGLSTPLAPPARPDRSLAKREAKAVATAGPLPLTIIVLIQVVLSLRLVWSNTAFEDEALYIWSGHLELAHWVYGTTVPNFVSYFSGSPAVYPPLAALADTFGLAGARLLSLAFMVGATCFLYGTACRLMSRRTGIAAAALFVAFGMTQQLSAFATYDPMAVFLLAAAAWLTVRSARRPSEWGLIGAALAMGLADAAKYSSALWNPVIIALAALALEQGPAGRRVFRAGRLTMYLAVVVGGALYVAGHSYVSGIVFTTVIRKLAGNSTPGGVLLLAWGWLGALLAISALGVLLSRSDGTRRFVLALVLFAAVLLAPLDQARISTATSLHKHVVFGAWFACIVAGYALDRLSRIDTRPAWGVVVVGGAAALLFFPGQGQAWTQEHVWPSAAQTMSAMSSAVQQDGCPCLMFANSVADYYLRLPANEVYTVSSTTLNSLNQISVVQTGIQRGTYGVIEIDGNELPADYRVMSAALHRSPFYKLVADIPWPGHPKTPSQVWERVIP